MLSFLGALALFAYLFITLCMLLEVYRDNKRLRYDYVMLANELCGAVVFVPAVLVIVILWFVSDAYVWMKKSLTEGVPW